MRVHAGRLPIALPELGSVVGLALAFLLPILGQRYLQQRSYPLDGIIFYAVGLYFFVRVVLVPRFGPPIPITARVPAEPWTGASAGLARPGRRFAFLLSCAFALIAFQGASGNQFRPNGIAAWLGALACYWYATSEPWRLPTPPLLRGWRLSPSGLSLSLSWLGVAVVAVIGIAIFYRYWQLPNIPYEMTSDHVEKLFDVKDVLDGEWRVFFPRNTGRESMQFYLAAATAHFVGLNHLALKLGTAFMGVVAVVGTYCFARELVNAQVGLLAAFFMAVGKWAVEISRVGLRFPFAPAFTAWSLFFAVRALRHQRRNDYLLCGIMLGLGLHTYSPFRVVPPFVFAILGLAWLWRLWRGEDEGGLRHLLAAFGAMLLVFLPLGRYMLENGQMFWYRTLTRMGEAEQPIEGSPIAIFLGNVRTMLLSFNWQGDNVWVNTVPGDTLLDPISAALLVLGCAVALVLLVRWRQYRWLMAFAAFFALTLPSTLALAFPIENPSVVRMGALQPVVYTLVALGLYALAHRARRLLGPEVGPPLLALAALVVLWQTARLNYDRYFIDYAIQYRQSAGNSRAIGEAILGWARAFGGSPERATLVLWPHWVDTRAVGIVLGRIGWEQVLQDVDDAVALPDGGNGWLYVLNSQDLRSLARLRELYPRGVGNLVHTDVPGREFYVFYAPPLAEVGEGLDTAPDTALLEETSPEETLPPGEEEP